jgi:Uma2 family endonuclease
MRPLPIRFTEAGHPMAPSQEEWDALTDEERAAVVAALPGEVTDAEMAPPEGDRHFRAKTRTLDALRGFFGRQKRRIYLAAELPTYYPAERRFAPDLLAVLDVEDRERDSWIVSAEGRGLDWVLEVHVGGDRKKDAERNVERYARLGIPEYFLYDRARERLFAYRLAPGARTYTPIVPQRGLYASHVLGLDVQVESDRLRFYAGTALLLESEELIVRLEAMLDDVQRRAEDEARRREEETRRREEETRRREEETRRREEETRRREEETRRREEAEAEVARLRAELERLRR